ncbi:MAG: ribonuclease J [Bacillales bacterium]|nr:ribonuclease J [Bacillales bacterium]
MMDDKIKIFALGGLDERGKNLYVVEINEDIFIFDCGSKYPTNAIPGVDSLIPNFDYLKENKHRVKAYIISHAHEDKYGALPYIYHEIPAPIVTSRFTATIIEYFTSINEVNNEYQFDYIEKSGYKTIAGRRFHFTQVSHSVPYAYSFSVETSQGLITYTSDYVLDFNNLSPEYKFHVDELQNIKNNVFILLSDSTNAHIPGHASPDYLITSKIEHHFEYSTGKIFAALFSTNMMALNEILLLAVKYNKTIIVVEKESEYMLQNVFKQKKYIDFLGQIKFEKLENLNRIRDKDTLVLLVNVGSSLYRDIISFVNGGFTKLHVEFNSNDTFILDCPSSPLNEVLATEALDETYKTGCKIVHFSKKTIKTMHACQEDIKSIIAYMKPKYYIPISGSFTNMMTNAKIALSSDSYFNYSNIFVLDNGMILYGENGVCKVDYKNIIPTGDVLIDGSDIGNIGNNVIEERNQLSKDGIVIMGVTVSSKKGEIVGGPDVQMRGFVFLKESENLLHTITDLFLDQVRIYLTGYSDSVSFEDKIIDRVSHYIFRETGKRPVIIPAIIDLDK